MALTGTGLTYSCTVERESAKQKNFQLMPVRFLQVQLPMYIFECVFVLPLVHVCLPVYLSTSLLQRPKYDSKSRKLNAKLPQRRRQIR